MSSKTSYQTRAKPSTQNAGIVGTQAEIAAIPTDELCWMIGQLADLPPALHFHPLIWPRYRLSLLELRRRAVDAEVAA